MRLRHLRYFIAVAEELNFSRASARLHIEPSPLSRAIGDLEHNVGVKLLHRSRGRIRLTAAGETFREDALRVLMLYQEARKHAHSIAAGNHGRVRIGLADGLAQPNVTHLLALCREQEPRTAVSIRDMTEGEMLAALNLDLIDAGFTIEGEPVAGFVKEVVWSERPTVAIPRHHPLLSFDKVPLAEVLRYPLVMCHPERCASGYRQFLRSLHANGLPMPLIAEYIYGHESMMQLVAAGYGIGLGLETQAALFHHPDVILRPGADDQYCVLTYIVTTDDPVSPPLERFIERARRIGGIAQSEGNNLTAGKA